MEYWVEETAPSYSITPILQHSNTPVL
jgi:hypothetical protein